MARIDSKVIFITTSPRTPAKMIPEIGLLNTRFSGQKWNTESQRAFQSGQRQYETEGEPVTRHLAKYKRETEKPAYCLFIAPIINDACKAHFYALHKMNIQYYGGTSIIVPLPLSVFIKMVEDSYNANFVPEPRHVQRFFERSNELANSTDNEVEWYNGITQEALKWLIE